MLSDHVRDAAATAAIFGFFAAAWFGWAQERPPPSWRPALVIGSVLALLIAATGGALTWLWWARATVFDPGTAAGFGVVVGVEVVLAAGGVVVLARRQRLDLAAAWVGLVVGAHLIPLGPLLQFPLLSVAGAAAAAASVAGVAVARTRDLPVSAVVGTTIGTILAAAALGSLVAAVSLT